ncbi:MAG: lipopolysaccharide biosynthesis protein [Candidatus Cryptobacteroides sp.]
MLESDKRIARNTLFLYIRMAVVLLISLYTTRAVLQVLGIENYGIYNVVCGFVSMFTIFNVAFSFSITRFYNEAIGKGDLEALSKVYSTSFFIQCLLAVLVVAVVEAVGLWYVSSKMVIPPDRLRTAMKIFQFSVAAMAVTFLQAPFSALIMAKEHLDYYAFVSVANSLFNLLNVFILKRLSCDKLFLYGLLCFAVSVLVFLLYFLFCRIRFKELKLFRSPDKALFGRMLSFSGWSLLDPVAYTMRGQGCNMVLNAFFGPVANAAYSLSIQISNALDQFTGNISTAFTPQLQQSYASGDEQRALGLTFSLSKITFVLLTMLAIPLAVEMDYVLNLWLKGSVPDHTIRFATLIIVVKMMDCLQNPLTRLTQATGRIRSYMLWASLLVSLTLPLGYFLLKAGLEAESLFVGMVVITFLNLLLCLYITSRNVGSLSFGAYLGRVIIPCFLHAALLLGISAVPSRLMEPSFLRLVLTCLLSVAATLLMAPYLLLGREERARVFAFVKQKIKFRQ